MIVVGEQHKKPTVFRFCVRVKAFSHVEAREHCPCAPAVARRILFRRAASAGFVASILTGQASSEDRFVTTLVPRARSLDSLLENLPTRKSQQLNAERHCEVYVRT